MLYVELLLVVLTVAILVGRRIFFHFFERCAAHSRRMLVQEFIESIGKSGSLPALRYKLPLLLEVLEEFSLSIRGDRFEEVKKEIASRRLLPLARKWVHSYFWLRRHFAARCFDLMPLAEDESLIIKLLDDSVFLVRSEAASAAIQLESQDGVTKVLKRMNVQSGYGRYLYADLLSNGSKKVLEILLSIGEQYIPASLEVFSLKTVGRIPFLETVLRSSDKRLRFWALKALIRNPIPGDETWFLQALEDPDPALRVCGAEGLGRSQSEPSVIALAKALKDAVWSVRLAAAKSLKQRGQTDLLSSQKEKLARETAQYVMEFESYAL